MCRLETLLGFLLVAAVGCAEIPPVPAPPMSAEAPEPSPAMSRYHTRFEDLPQPYASEDAVNPPTVTQQPADVSLTMPPRFSIETFATGFQRPRWMALAPNGDVFVSDVKAGSVVILRDADRDGVAEARFTFAETLMQPFGLAFHDGFLYVSCTNAVLRFPYRPGQTAAEGDGAKVADLPGRGYREHWTRNVVFGPDGKTMFVTIGSESNVSPEDDPMRATIAAFNPDGSGRRTYASGLRNPTGLAFHPATGKLWAVVQERDRLGDDLVPDYLTEVREGGFYGWPYAYLGPHEDPRRKGERPDLVEKTIAPDVLVQAHSSVLGLVFYDGSMFPAPYRGDAFVAFHGSWNRTHRTGYKIVRVLFRDGKPTGEYEDFIAGWMLAPDRKEVWGRPVGLLVLNDGSLLIADDGANKIWRVVYR